MVDRVQRPGVPAGPSPRPPGPAHATEAPAARGDAHDAAGPVRPLPGGLDDRRIVNSNHPEVVRGPGIALSTLPWAGPAHQDVALEGAFELFAHHQNRAKTPLHQAVVLHNPGPGAVTVGIGPSASYVTREAPYRDTAEDVVGDPDGRLVSGPGDRVATALLRGERAIPAEAITLAPGETRLVHAKAIPAGNEATSQYTFEATGPIHAAVVIEDAPPTPEGVAARLRAGQRVAPNPDDKPPAPPGWLDRLLGWLPFKGLLGAPGEVSRAFRGTIAVETTDADGRSETRYLHVGQKLGQDGTRPLHTVVLAPGEATTVRVRFRYPANATAPHVLRLAAAGAAPPA